MKHIGIGYWGILLGLFLLGSCKKVDLGSNQGNLSASDITQNSAKLKWTPSSIAGGYKISAQGIENIKVAGQSASSYTLTGLNPNTQYQVTMKRIHAEGGPEVQWGYTEFTTTANILSINDYDITDKTVIVNKTSSISLDKYQLYDSNSSLVKDDIKENVSGTTITDLAPNTSYIVKAIKGGVEKGSISFKTLPNYGEKVKFVKTTESLADILSKAEDGYVICLYKGYYTIKDGSVTIPTSITLQAADTSSSTTTPVIGGAIVSKGKITIKYIKFLGEGVENNCLELKEKSLGAILKDVRISNYRGRAIYYNSTVTEPASISCTNCAFSKIRPDYLSGSASKIAVFDINTPTGKTSVHLIFKNCAFSNSADSCYFIRYNRQSNDGKDSIVVDGCSLYEISDKEGSALINVTGVDPANTYIGWKNTTTSNTKCKWWNVTENKHLSSTEFYNNNYYVSSVPGLANVDTKSPKNELPGFEDASNDNLTINNSTLIGSGIGAKISF